MISRKRIFPGPKGKSAGAGIWWLGLLLVPLFSLSQLQVDPIFSHHMLLQRDQPVRIWGRGVPGSLVQLAFAGKKSSTRVRPDSTWKATFPAQKANSHPQALFIRSGLDSITLENILVGDVWLCSGQSNMEWPMSRELHWKEEMGQADQPLIRFLNPPPTGRFVYGVPYGDSLLGRLAPGKFYDWNGWQSCQPGTIASMSAVAYYFAKKVLQSEGIPIGIINLSIGGAPLETFISRDALAHHPLFKNKVMGNWLLNDALPLWVRERGMQNVGILRQAPGDDLGPHHAYKPGFAYQSGILALKDFPIKGVLFYQGESNAEEEERVLEYKELFKLMVRDYRQLWRNRRLPVYWVQLSSIERRYWPLFRDMQRKLLTETKHGGMAVTSDIGLPNDVHPPDKKTVGERLAYWALADTYHADILPSGPLPASVRYLEGKLVVRFLYGGKGLGTADGKALRGFSLDGRKEIAAAIVKDEIHIPVSSKPEILYYGWKPFSDANLVNSANLPASTFRIKVN